MQQCAGDLDELLLADPQVADQSVGVELLLQASQDLDRSLPLGLTVQDPEPGPLLSGQEDVVLDRQVGAEAELLVDDDDAEVGSLLGVS